LAKYPDVTTSTVYTITLGCRLNSYESERMTKLAEGASETVIVNTCAVTSEAVRQSRQAIRKAHRRRPGARVVVTGCASELDPAGFGAMPEVTAVIANADKLSPAAWERTDTAHREPRDPLAVPLPAQVAVRSHLEVQNGCDHRCTFCIIPFGRGQARSKPPAMIVEEAAHLVRKGAREIVLTGVDLTSYGPDLGPGLTLSDAIEVLLDRLPEGIRIRLSSIDGAEVDDRLFALVTQERRIAPHLHLSLQSGDDMTLKRMRRRHSRAHAVTLARRLKAARPELALGADLIAGFPTETDEMFANTVRLIADCDLSFVHVFPFSPRQGTPAARMPQVDRQTVKSRAARLRAAADSALERHLDRSVGQRSELLVETMRDGKAVGKLPDFTDATLELPTPVGEIVPVQVLEHDGRRAFVTKLKESA
jgi:threonylcarbamoyladenosine tRNA methylthiotransferase MtaB